MRAILLVVGLVLVIWPPRVVSQYDWIKRDNFDRVFDQMNSITPQNCMEKQPSELYLEDYTVTQKPTVESVKKEFIFKNRTNLVHVYNVALRNAFLMSFLLQRNFDFDEPGLVYYYTHLASDIAGNVGYINGSGIIFDNNCAYTHWYKNYFNKTVPLFGPRGHRLDDFWEPHNWRNQWTNNTISVVDLGAGRDSNYSTKFYRANEWYHAWLPDLSSDKSAGKVVYNVRILKANKTGLLNDQEEIFTFHGPPGPEDNPGPAKWTRPYYDCGRTNRWLISATSPIVDLYPRHTPFRARQNNIYVAVSVADIDFLMIDINQCDVGLGNNKPNAFSGTHKCKPTTRCEPLMGHGFRRGGYQCACKPSYRYPKYQRGPYLGTLIEKSTNEEYEKNFDCIPVQLNQVRPHDDTDITRTVWDKSSDRSDLAGRKKRQTDQRDFYQEQLKLRCNDMCGLLQNTSDLESCREFAPVKNVLQNRLMRALTQMGCVTKQNCHEFRGDREHMLRMPGDAMFGGDDEFEPQARVALQLATFLSNFYQTNNPAEEFPTRQSDQDLIEEQIYGEVLASVAGDVTIYGVGVFFDLNRFRDRPYFGPYAFRTGVDKEFKIVDYAGMKEGYANEIWFKTLKSRWANNADKSELEEFVQKFTVRSDPAGRSKVRYESGYPIWFYVPTLKHGQWFDPFFDCDGHVDDWVITYAVPFFGKDKLNLGLEFKGVVTVDIQLINLDVNQCFRAFYVPNAFGGTDRCDRETSDCVFRPGLGFRTGGYQCDCKEGYEYPFVDQGVFYDGQLMETEYNKQINNSYNRLETLVCRIAAAGSLRASMMAIAAAFVVVCLLTMQRAQPVF